MVLGRSPGTVFEIPVIVAMMRNNFRRAYEAIVARCHPRMVDETLVGLGGSTSKTEPRRLGYILA